MGSASREALAAAVESITAALERSAPSELLDAAAVLDAQPSLATALADATATVESKHRLVADVFSSMSLGAVSVLNAAVAGRWSTVEEFVAGVEQLGIRVAAVQAEQLDDELIAIADLVDSDHALELALGSKLGATDAKLATLRTLISNRVSDNALKIAEQLVAHPRGKRVSVALREAARTSAAQSGQLLALVTVAQPLSSEREQRLQQALTKNAGQSVKISTSIDPNLVGGIRVQIADEVIDGSVRRRLDDLRLQLA
jgi:F-type H+-transporting ATPase subunit delta